MSAKSFTRLETLKSQSNEILRSPWEMITKHIFIFGECCYEFDCQLKFESFARLSIELECHRCQCAEILRLVRQSSINFRARVSTHFAACTKHSQTNIDSLFSHSVLSASTFDNTRYSLNNSSSLINHRLFNRNRRTVLLTHGMYVRFECSLEGGKRLQKW